MKKIITFIFLVTCFLFLVTPVSASDLNIECFGTGPCSKTGADPLFSQAADGYWLPGHFVNKTFTLKNSAADTREAFVEPRRTSETDILEDVMEVRLSPSGGTALFEGLLTDFYSLGSTSLGNISPGGSKEFTVYVRMKPETDNNYQGRSTKFDLDFSFWLAQSDSGTTETSVVSSSSPQCNDAKPGTPANFTVVAGPGSDQTTISWTPVFPYTDFLVAYSDDSTSPKWGNPSVGNTDHYTVSGLGGGVYYFWVREQNGCMPGGFAGPVSIIGPTGGQFVPLENFSPETLGVTAPLPAGEVKGEDISLEKCQKCVWWPILLLEIVVITIYYYLARKSEYFKRHFAVGLVGATFLYLVFMFINRAGCPDGVIDLRLFTIPCKLFWILDGAAYVICSLFFAKFHRVSYNGS